MDKIYELTTDTEKVLSNPLLFQELPDVLMYIHNNAGFDIGTLVQITHNITNTLNTNRKAEITVNLGGVGIEYTIIKRDLITSYD